MRISDDQTFRAVLLCGLALFGPVGAYFRLKSRTDEKLDRTQEGWLILISLRLIAVVAWIGVMAYLVSPSSMAWSSVKLPILLRWSGALFGLLGGSLMIWTFRNLGANLTDTVVTRREHTLVTSGPYRWIRHPFYGAAALLVVSASLISSNLFILISGALILTLLIVRTKKEEQKLVERFGDDYRKYMQRTGRFFPILRGRTASSTGN